MLSVWILPLWSNHITGAGQKPHTGSVVLPVADNILKWMFFASVLLVIGPNIWFKIMNMQWKIWYRDAWYLWCKNSKNLLFLDILAVIQLKSHIFEIRQKAFLPNAPWNIGQNGLFVRFWKYGLLTELQARTTRNCRFLYYCIITIRYP